MTEVRKVYWDSCAWIALIGQEPVRFEILKKIFDFAKRGEIQIWTSTLTYAEVYKKKCGEGDKVGTYEFFKEQIDELDDILTQDFVQRIELNQVIGLQARALLSKTPGLNKPADGIHLASALYFNLDEMHTFDNEDLLKLNGKMFRKDGKKFKIAVPSNDVDGPLFEIKENVRKDTN